jgi:putative nucleotidyltransferase with HDIG domain
MVKVKFPNKFRVYLPLIVLFFVLLLITPKSGNFKYDYRKGDTWNHETLIAQFDFPVLKTDEQIAQEVSEIVSSVAPYYRQVTDVAQEAIRKLNSEKNLGRYESLKPEALSAFVDIYERGLIEQNEGASDVDAVFIRKDKKAMSIPVSELYTVATAKKKLVSSLMKKAPYVNVDSICVANGLYALLTPNLVFDQKTTDMMQREAYDNISETSGYIKAGEVLISNGEVVTAEHKQIIDSYKAEYQENLGYDGPIFLLWLGDAVIVLAIILLLFLTILYTNPKIFDDSNRYLYLLLIFALASVAAIFTDRANPEFLYFIPFTLITLYLLSFFKKRVVLPVYVVSLLPVLIFTQYGLELFVMFMIAGVISILSFAYFNKGWQQFLTAFFVFLTMLGVHISFRLIQGDASLQDFNTLIYMALGALLSVAGYPLIFLFEKLFALVSNAKLIDLCDTNNKLLRELAQKAPGTFQHSLQVMNMADEAARSIGANVLLVRAGAMYHDIGKMMNPLCFVENSAPGVNYHANLSPKDSATEIIRHVQDGVALADKHGLPSVVKEFITAHHGTTFTGYFYNQYLNEGGSPDDVKEFFYNGTKPVSKEQVILMLCDAIEAASRTLTDFSAESISAFVEKMVGSKMEQFDDSEISLKELNVVKGVLKTYLAQAHHVRVVYPKRKTE